MKEEKKFKELKKDCNPKHNNSYYICILSATKECHIDYCKRLQRIENKNNSKYFGYRTRRKQDE